VIFVLQQKLIYKNGVCHVSLAPAETLVIHPSPELVEFVLNESQHWGFAQSQVQSIQIESRDKLLYEPSPHVDYLRRLFAEMGLQTGTCVDIGAFDGLHHSHTLDWFQQGWQGLAVECHPVRFTRLSQAYQRLPQVAISRCKVTPDNLVDLLRLYDIPVQFEFFSLDIDSYDYAVLAALLQHYRPQVICAEVNEVIPPPLKFAVKFQPDFSLDLESRFYGMSLASLAELAQAHGYRVLVMYYMDVFLIAEECVQGTPQSLEQIYQAGFRNRPMPDYYQDYPFDVAALQAAEPEVALALLRAGFADFSGHFDSSL